MDAFGNSLIFIDMIQIPFDYKSLLYIIQRTPSPSTHHGVIHWLAIKPSDCAWYTPAYKNAPNVSKWT